MFKTKKLLEAQFKLGIKLDVLHEQVAIMNENFKKLNELLEKKKIGRPKKVENASYKKPIQKG